MFNQGSFKIQLLFAFIMVLTGLSTKASTDSVITRIKSTPLSEDGFKSLCMAIHLDSAKAAFAVNNHIYLQEDQSCGVDIPVYGPLSFDYGQIVKSLHQGGPLKSLTAYTTVLYQLIAQPNTLPDRIPTVLRKINFKDRSLSCANLFDSLSTGAWAFDCGGHAEMAKVFLDSLGAGHYVTKIGRLERKNGDEVDHVVALVYYRENNQWYGAFMDCQNGKLGPVLAGLDSIPSLVQQKEALDSNQFSQFEIVSIPESDLHKKRNLMDRALYCNVLPDSNSEYRMALPQSGFHYERLSYSALHYIWFKAGFLDLEEYMDNVVRILVENAPDK